MGSVESELTVRSSRRWWILAVMSLSIFTIFVDATVVNTALPTITRELGATTAQLQWIVDSYSLVLAGLVLASGTVGDKYGRRRWLGIGMVVFAGGAVGAALSTSPEMLIAYRALQGLGAALVMPATLSIITTVFPREERVKAIGIWTAVGSMGLVAGPTIGGYLVDEVSWSAVFWLHLPIVALTLAGLKVVPESRDPRNRPLDVPGALLAMGALLAIVFAVIEGNEAGWSSATILTSFAVGGLLLAAFVLVELQSKAPMLQLQLFKERDLSGSLIIITLTMFTMFAVFFSLGLFYQLVQGRSALHAGMLILPAAAGMMIGGGTAAPVVKAIGPRVIFLIASGVQVALLLALTQFTATVALPIEIGWMFGLGLTMGFIMPVTTDTVMAAVPVEDAGVGSALNDVSRELGGALGIAVLGSVLNGVYRSRIDESLTGVAPPQVVEAARDSIGVAKVTAQSLPPDVASAVAQAADAAYVDAMGIGALVGIVFVGLAIVTSATLIPWRPREVQVELDDLVDGTVAVDVPAGATPAPAYVEADGS